MMQSIFLTGLGGQGVITLANLISELAAGRGLRVSQFNAKGMAQRGGRVTSELRMSDDPEHEFGARISEGKADILIGMEIGETINSLPFLKHGAAALLLDHAFVPTTMLLKKQEYPSFERLTELCSAKTERIFPAREARHPYNMYLMGVFTAAAPTIDPGLAFCSKSGVEQMISAKLKRGLEQNLQTFQQGYEHGKQLIR